MAHAKDDYMTWWREARFGLFIHWGLYAIPAGVWKGELVPSIGEWIMFRAQIPAGEYEQLARQFYPAKFNAAEWVQVAKNAGMKYITLTSKHHDGFALYKSPCDPYNIVDATPYRRDIIKELAEACREAGIKMCFYYSQSQDWHEPNGLGNTWDFGPDEEKDFQAYLDSKVKPQLKELLTQYGPVGMIWFDTPKSITEKQSLELKEYVKSIQPDCLVSGRIGNELGDYGSLGDNQHPAGPAKGDWETPCTLNDTWGYKSYDENWKTEEELLDLLVNCTAKGVNYLLNVGPDQEGVIPRESVERLEAVGRWLKVNGEAVYGTKASPYPYDLDTVGISQKGNTLYLMFKGWPGTSFSLVGLKNKILGTRFLADGRVMVPFSQSEKGGVQTLTLQLPKEAPEGYFPVVALDLDGAPEADQRILQQPDGSTALPAHIAVISGNTDGAAKINQTGVMQGWNNPGTRLEWEFMADQPGRFAVTLEMAMNYKRTEGYGTYPVKVTIDGSSLDGKAGVADIPADISGDPWFTATHKMGEVQIKTTGVIKGSVEIGKIPEPTLNGFTLATVRLKKIN